MTPFYKKLCLFYKLKLMHGYRISKIICEMHNKVRVEVQVVIGYCSFEFFI